jgi:hypothetical protein
LAIATMILGIKDATDEKSSQKVEPPPHSQAYTPDHAVYQWVGWHRVAPFASRTASP